VIRNVNIYILEKLSVTEKVLMQSMERTGFFKESLRDSIELSLSFSKFSPLKSNKKVNEEEIKE
jgi:hypothetical protein